MQFLLLLLITEIVFGEEVRNEMLVGHLGLGELVHKKQALRNSCELLRRRRQLHKGHETACKLMKLYACL